jgi:AraC-like DNA-binding protein
MAQGLICAILLFLHRPVRANKSILAFILLTFIVLSFKILIHTLGIWQKPHWRYLPLAFDLLIQPLFYLYTLSLTQTNYRFKGKSWLHFLPMFCFLCHAIWVYLVSLKTNDIAQKDILAESLYYNRIKELEDILSVLSGIIYWILSFRQIQAYKRWLNANISNASYPTYNWLRNILIAMGVLVATLMINIPLEIFFNFGARHFIQWQFFYFYLAVLVYYLGFTGYQQKDFEVAFQSEKRSAVALDAQQVSLVKEKLLKTINEDKVYLDAELNLSALAKQIEVGEGMLSTVINEEFQQNFRNFINEKRVEEVKRKLLRQEYKHLSILGIALESGFNSEASFYRVFKSITGQSPKDFLQKNNSQNSF